MVSNKIFNIKGIKVRYYDCIIPNLTFTVIILIKMKV